MSLYYEHGGIQIWHGDSREILPSLPKCDCFLTDPFYGVGGAPKSGNARTNGRANYNITAGWEDSESAVVSIVVPVVGMLIAAGLRGALTPGNKCLFHYPKPDDIGCFFAPACNGISRWGMISTHPILYYGSPPYTWQTGWPQGTFPTGRMTRGLSPDTNHPCPGCTFIQADILALTPEWIRSQCFDFICASSPCEQFSVHGMKHFHPNPPYPTLGIDLFNHTRALCDASEVPYVMENVRAAQAFVGNAALLCGPFALWGKGVPTRRPAGDK